MTEDVIRVDGLVKDYGKLKAVNGVSFTVKEGSLFAFLGTNGAGKSTTIKIITTTLKQTEGQVEVAGFKLGIHDAKIRELIGVVFQQSILDPLLTVRENLKVRASFYNVENPNDRIDELSSLIGLGEFIDRRYGTLSGGQKRRADIARALINTPKILFLDEPTTGLDPKSREDVWRTIVDLQKEAGLTVFLTTHYMEEAERADDVYVIDRGERVAFDKPQALRSKYSTNTLRLTVSEDSTLGDKLQKNGYEVRRGAGYIEVSPNTSSEALGILKKYESQIEDFEFRHGNLDDVFLRLTKGGEL